MVIFGIFDKCLFNEVPVNLVTLCFVNKTAKFTLNCKWRIFATCVRENIQFLPFRTTIGRSPRLSIGTWIAFNGRGHDSRGWLPRNFDWINQTRGKENILLDVLVFAKIWNILFQLNFKLLEMSFHGSGTKLSRAYLLDLDENLLMLGAWY